MRLFRTFGLLLIVAPTTILPTPDVKARQERFLALLLPVHKRLALFVRAMARDRDEAFDLEGETILRAWAHFEELQHEEAFLSYLFTIATRVCRKRRWRARIFERLETAGAVEMPDPSPGPELAADVAALYEAIERLPKAQAEAIVLFEITGLSIAEICEIQGGTLSSVKSRLARGRARLARILGAEASGVLAHDR